MEGRSVGMVGGRDGGAGKLCLGSLDWEGWTGGEIGVSAY
jgi:hypothetical protein